MRNIIAAGAQIAAAQHTIATHLQSADTCPACGQPSPCPLRQAAESTLDAYGCLPRRRPGASLAAAGYPLHQPVNAPRRGPTLDRKPWRGWFESRINPAVGRARVRRSTYAPS